MILRITTKFTYKSIFQDYQSGKQGFQIGALISHNQNDALIQERNRIYFLVFFTAYQFSTPFAVPVFSKV